MRAEALDRVKLVFTLFDVDGSGSLEPVDFELMSDRVVAVANDSGEAAKSAIVESLHKWWSTLESELDANHDGKITFEEFTACVLNPERFDETIAQFADALAALGDPDGDGLIERPLFNDLMIAIGFDAPNINALFDAFGPDTNDRITVDVWVEGIKDYYAPEKAGIAGDHLVETPAQA